MDMLLRIVGYIPFCFIVGCSTQAPLQKNALAEPLVTTQSAPAPKPVLVNNYKRPEELSREEIIDSAKQCQEARMKPVIIYVYQTTEFGKIKTPVNVHCEVYRLER